MPEQALKRSPVLADSDPYRTEAPSAASTDSLRATPNLVGKRLGPYQLLEEIGCGGMGSVYKAKHVQLGKVVAIKVLPTDLTDDPAAVARFEREMLAVGAVDHPNIVRALDAGQHSGLHYLSLEYVDGLDLQKWVTKNGPLSSLNACKIIRQAAIGLAHAHERGLVHRDIKPSNLILSRQGKIKVLDLGLARLSDAQTASHLTGRNVGMGTPDYMAPEQWFDSHSSDAGTDLYSLGCTLFFLLNGRAPFDDGKHTTHHSKMTAHIHEPPPALSSSLDTAPDVLHAIYRKLLAKDRSDRFASARELVAAIQPLCSSRKYDPSIFDAPPVLTDGTESSIVPLHKPAPEPMPAVVAPVPTPPAATGLTHIGLAIAQAKPIATRTSTSRRNTQATWTIAAATVCLAVLLLVGAAYFAANNMGPPTATGSQVASASRAQPVAPPKLAPPPASAARAKIERTLAEPAEVEFIDTPLKDVVDYLSQQYAMPIRLDAEALQRVGVDVDQPVTAVYKGISLNTVLRNILGPLSLQHRVDDDQLLVTAK